MEKEQFDRLTSLVQNKIKSDNHVASAIEKCEEAISSARITGVEYLMEHGLTKQQRLSVVWLIRSFVEKNNLVLKDKVKKVKITTSSYESLL